MRPIVANGVLSSALLAIPLPINKRRYAPGDLNNRFGELLRFKLDDLFFEVASGAITLMLNDQLTFWLTIALNFAFKAIEAI